MTAVVPVYRCGAAPDSHRVPSRRSGWPEHRRGINLTEGTGRVKPAGIIPSGAEPARCPQSGSLR